MSKVEIVYHKDAERALLTGPELYAQLDRLGFTIVGHAVPHVGVDTGALVNSLSHRVEEKDGVLQAVLGSGAGAGVQPIWYASEHMAGVKDPRATVPKTKRPSRKAPGSPTKKAPTRPFKKALDELGIDYKVAPGGFES
jgi:hypothetical protein